MGKFGEFLKDLAPGLPLVGGILGNLIQRGQSKKDLAELNQYNDPVHQIARLRQAGLPMAAIGNAGSQSSVPETTDLGIAEGISSWFTTKAQQEQYKLLKEQVRKASAEADIQEGLASWMKEPPEEGVIGGLIPGKTNQAYQLNAERDIKRFQHIIEYNRQDINQLESLYQKSQYEDGSISKLFQTTLDKLLQDLANSTKQGELLGLQLSTEKQMNEVKTNIYQMMKSGKFPNFSAILYALAFGGAKMGNFKL